MGIMGDYDFRYIYTYIQTYIVQAVNAWRLKQRYTGKKEPYLAFLQDLINEVITIYRQKPATARRSYEVPVALSEEMRYPKYLTNLPNNLTN